VPSAQYGRKAFFFAAIMSMAVAHPPTTHDALAAHYLGRWRSPRLTAADIERAETWATATDGAMAMLTVQGAWRAKVMNGTLWVKWLGAKGTWQERASVLRILLAAVDGAGTGRLPDVDFVYVHSDQDPSPRRGWPCTGPVPRTCRGPQVAVLTNAIEHAGGAKASFPVPELTWVGWGERVPPWCRLSRTLRETAARHPWERRDDRAFFSGSLENGRWRRRLGALARVQHEEGATDLFVHSVDSAFLRWGKAKGSGLGANRAEGAAGSSASLPVEASCGYRYALSLPGHGYSSRLKTLLACGCVVIHVHSPWNEWCARDSTPPAPAARAAAPRASASATASCPASAGTNRSSSMACTTSRLTVSTRSCRLCGPCASTRHEPAR